MKRHFTLVAAAAAVCLSARAAVFCIDERTGAVDVPASLAVGDAIDISLSGERQSISLTIVSDLPGFGGARAFSARVGDGPVASSVLLSGGGMYIEARDMAEGVLHKVSVRGGGDVVVENVDLSKCGRGECVEVEAPVEADVYAKNRSRSLTSSPFDDVVVAPAPVSIDMMLVFENGARDWIATQAAYGGSITNFAVMQIAKMNQVLENTGLHTNFWFRLVDIMSVDATMTTITTDSTATLKNGADSGEGPYGSVKTRRDACGADCVSLIIDTGTGYGTTGVGYITKGTNPTTWATAYREWCYSVCAVRSVADSYTLSHEVGHNMGLAHSKTLDTWSKSTFEYANGYNFTDSSGNKYHTVMAYDYDYAGGSYTYGYVEIPYFSSPDYSLPDGTPVGSGTANSTRALRSTCAHIAKWREHVVPYNWEVLFLDDSGTAIPEGTRYFSGTLYVTLTNCNAASELYYTYDGETVYTCKNGQRFPVMESKTITAYVVVDGIEQPSTSVTFEEGQVWSGESGRNGGGAWIADGSTLAWNGQSEAYDDWTPSVFADIAGVASATVTVHGAVSPCSTLFTATSTAYTFDKGSEGATLRLPDAAFAPPGDLVFNLPVQFDAVAFTNPANHTLAFNAPFGQTLTGTSGYCTNMIGIGAYGTLVVAPGAGKVQYFDRFNNVGWFYNNAKIKVGAGTVVFKGPVGNRGLFGSTQFAVAKEGRVVLDVGDAAYDPFSDSVVSGDGTVVYRSLIPSSASRWSGSGWTGTVALTNIAAGTLALDQYGGTNSTVLLVGMSGYPGSSGNTNIFFHTTLELVDGADGTPAWTLNNGYSSDCTFIDRLRGDGTLKSTLSPSSTYVRQGIVVADASDFTGSLDLAGTQFTFGGTGRKNDGSQTGTIYIDEGYSVTNVASWKANGLVVNGRLVKKGTLAIAKSIVFGDGASLVVDSLPSDGVVLTSNAIETNGTLSVSVIGDDEPYVARIEEVGGGRRSLVLAPAPLPENVPVSITLRFYDKGEEMEKIIDAALPSQWATNYYPSLATAKAVAAKYNDTAANGATVWQCYMLGLDPTNAASRVSLSLSVGDGKIRFSVGGLGEAHSISGVDVFWSMRTSTNLVTDVDFSKVRESMVGLAPAFSEHSMPDSPVSGAAPVDSLFYKILATFIPADEDEDD